ncbi:MAG TPA: FAD-binding oxidoreductase [Vicinamibacterales bacterium]|nr:FAD-binding oxidoreductase [Vicinamibacterales bacterium]
MPGYGRRYWAERTTRRRNYPAFKGEHTADVVVIGGGLTGCMTASVLASGGLDVVLVEAGRLASGATAGGLGVVLSTPGESYHAIEAAVGRRNARVIWKETERSSRELTTALGKLPIGCDVTSAPGVLNAVTPADALALRREQKARKAGGQAASWVTAAATSAELGTESAGAIHFGHAATFDPVRAALGFAQAATRKRARVFERSRVKRTRFTRTTATVVLERGTVETRGIVVATGEPGPVAPQLRRHVRTSTGYVVVTEPLTAAMRREAGARRAVTVEPGADPHLLRWLPDHRAVFAGALSKPVAARLRDKALVQRTAQLMYEFSVRYPVISGLPARWGWDVPVVSTLDGLPWIGPHRNYPFHFFAVALGWSGDAMAWWAARAALRFFTSKARREDAVFGFTRRA